ncbi:serine hydrolase domain-containing protein [Actinoplanes couchii]|uniref:Serine hydrolase n=1 Tax=Actinoplanes couchii TaxID=403638 RepID=A0ABQ3XQU4_9ACTN|nr:serine hydrolase domain-containing protein [Actinoplanes couchii]MDR6317478.1 D-alanyl-D-alanine carboxypeptidase [Actinoplanes couchii]GID60780.1 serine hydrolase [Actinoplanes couchii]
MKSHVDSPQVLRRAGITALTVAMFLGGGAVPAAASESRTTDRPELRAAVDAFVSAGFTGMQVRVHDEHGEWTRTVGVRELGRPGKPPADGRFRIGSTTKTFTAALMLRLVADGRIGLDDAVAPHLPGYGLDPRITVRMLLQHTSGIFNFTGEYYPDGTVVPGITWSGQEWVQGRFRTYRPEELVRLALSHPGRFEPGTGWSYSNTNYVVARLLIEKVTGRPYAEQMRERVLNPLELRDTSAPGTSPAIPGPHAHAYYTYATGGVSRTVDVSRQNPSWISSAGEMISTTEDLHRFFAGVLGGKLFPAALVAEMRRPEPRSGEFGYGLGLMSMDTGADCSGTVAYHNGSVQGYATLMYSTPDGSRTLEASVTYVDDAAQSQASAGQKAIKDLMTAVFCAE